MNQHELYMHRCIELARLGAGYVAPNPMVGSVLVYEDRIIGEGYHRQYGQAHAEVNCINSVKEEDRHLIEKSIIYVSLEPCAHYGKTPPCADLIIRHKIPTVVVGCRDPFEQVDGKGIEKLEKAGIEVIKGVLESECKEMNKRFFTFHIKKRPYIILKWAQSKNRKIANNDFSRVFISNDFSNRLVHKWRSMEAGIMIGTNTALYDNPSLNTRNWTGHDPIRLVVDMNLRLPSYLQIFDKKQKTVIFNSMKHEDDGNLLYYKIDQDTFSVRAILKSCYDLHIQSILVEGGTTLLQSFVEEKLWDEARVIENELLIIDKGLEAPVLSDHHLLTSEKVSTDVISFYASNL
ncbi:bifunctional diaminohydroxyphosphoribosylaminopyrimidine deaminase/5-amino-6-(5-phosphoribosylamino)uracil reductase RibD [Segetibacter koreensis]|uniref:bifunctional diaminohydroxyphosphoribosylaminopyrimidine deaminase/5-amino-6-(5-phosphoribosylamino)uracil reductase RibD n=1 Tax=Segetibacter koreensis TaxID=398037 RepID=UPI000476CCFB|nr:bifunctional diaminohydroxyphosphoribosylaminopyrimidine deaminase/5-amino-6-(5-phosphoribosylamino)uracil reductase RibD [Segetibacter koreensis]